MSGQKGHKAPAITVLMPVFNAEDFIEEAVRSILGQTFTDFELLLIDDGCSDRSMQIVRSIADRRIKTVANPQNLGLIASLNIGLDRIRSKYMARADADDICMPERLQAQFQFMEQHSEVGACGTWFDSLLEDGTTVPGGRFSTEHDMIRLKHLYQIHIIHGTSILRTATIRQHRLRFDPDFRHAEDYDFFDRMGKVAGLANVPGMLYLIRHHDGRVSRQFGLVQRENADRVKRRIFADIGLPIDRPGLNLFEKLMYQDYAWFDREKAFGLGQLLSGLLKANASSHYFDMEFLRREMAVRFLHLCNALADRCPGMPQLLRQFGMARFSDAPKLFLTIRAKSLLRHLH